MRSYYFVLTTKDATNCHKEFIYNEVQDCSQKFGSGARKIVDLEGREGCHMHISVIEVGIIEMKCIITHHHSYARFSSHVCIHL